MAGAPNTLAVFARPTTLFIHFTLPAPRCHRGDGFG
jgi:hypothetical protein